MVFFTQILSDLSFPSGFPALSAFSALVGLLLSEFRYPAYFCKARVRRLVPHSLIPIKIDTLP
jgi:hypothetical protein